MPSPTTNSPSLQPALELIYLATLEPEMASHSLRNLLLNNPNYFASLTENSFKVVLNINGDTDYESLGCVRYIPLLDRVYASININRDAGYSFHVGARNSREYVRFYVSYDRGMTWQDKGMSAVNIVDEPGEKTRMHLVTRKVDLREDVLFSEVALVRAILSWNSPPPQDSPDWVPLWGNVAQTVIQVESMSIRRSRNLRTDNRIRIAEETLSKADLGLAFDEACIGPVGTVTSTGLFSKTAPWLHHTTAV